MEVSLYQAAAAMNATDRWQEMISDNLAASSIPGARKREISFSAVQAGLDSNVSSLAGSGYVIPSANAATNFSQGELHPTGNAMDVALEGPGLFSIRTADGQQAYSRNGEFQLNSQGQLVNTQGNLVLGEGGPIQMNAGNSTPITISATGEVSQGADIKGQIAVTEFGNMKAVTMGSGGLFTADAATAAPKAATTTGVRQGFVEASNTSPTLAMASLITAMRMFETNQKVMTMQSDRMSKAITELSGAA